MAAHQALLTLRGTQVLLQQYNRTYHPAVFPPAAAIPGAVALQRSPIAPTLRGADHDGNGVQGGCWRVFFPHAKSAR